MKGSEAIRIEVMILGDSRRLLLHFDWRPDWLQRIKGLEDARYSVPLHRYHIPATRKSYDELLALGIPIILPKTNQDQTINHSTHLGTAQGQLADQQTSDIEAIQPRPTKTVSPSSMETVDIHLQGTGGPVIECLENYLNIYMAYDKKEVAYIKTLHKAWWKKDKNHWVISNTTSNIESLQKRWRYWDDQAYQLHLTKAMEVHAPTIVTLYRVPTEPDVLYAEISGHRKMTTPLLQLGQASPTGKPHHYQLSDRDGLADDIIAAYKKAHIQVIDRSKKLDNRQAQKSTTERAKLLLQRWKGEDYQLARKIMAALVKRRYSWSTISSYLTAIIKANKWIAKQTNGTRNIDTASNDNIQNYLVHWSAKDLSDSAMNILVSALKYYYAEVSPRPDILPKKIQRPRRRKVLPRIISANSVLRMIDVTTNVKHKNIIVALYSSGLRLNELLTLKLEHILWDRNQIIIRSAKGKKDRSVMLSTWLTELLQHYFHTYKPTTYLIEGREAGRPYSSTSVQKIIKKAARKAKISQKVTPHVLRHCFATHLHDDGVDIGLIQQLLGHKHIQTTMIYTHVSTASAMKVTSPIDRLMNKKA